MTECYLQTTVETDVTPGTERIARSEKYWSIEEVHMVHGFKFKNMLLKFRSKADRKRFIKDYCKKERVLGTNSFACRMSPWPSVPYCGMAITGPILNSDGLIERMAKLGATHSELLDVARGKNLEYFERKYPKPEVRSIHVI